MPGACRGGEQGLPGMHGQIVAVVERVAERGEAFCGGDEDADRAVAQDVADLRGLEHGVDRHEDAARGAGAEGGGDELGALVEIDPDALGAGEAQPGQAAGESVERGLELLVAQLPVAGNHGDACGIACGRGLDEVVEQVFGVHRLRLSVQTGTGWQV
jgi:hypothetical protein